MQETIDSASKLLETVIEYGAATLIVGGIGFFLLKDRFKQATHENKYIRMARQVSEDVNIFNGSFEEDELIEDSIRYLSLSEALKTDEESTVKGVVQKVYRTESGYAGLLKDSSGTFPFFFNEDYTDSYSESGLALILINDSLDNKKFIEMDVTPNNEMTVLESNLLKYSMNGNTYEI